MTTEERLEKIYKLFPKLKPMMKTYKSYSIGPADTVIEYLVKKLYEALINEDRT